ncbi:MAG: YitT family protein [Bacillota bacterium]|nr:YitT family protein [Bacillota bacterium]
MEKNIKKLLAIIVGELICAFAITYFFVPHKLLSGGVGGISILLQLLTGYSTGVFIFLINIPLAILGFKKLSKSFMIYTFISYNLLSLFLLILNRLNFNFMVDDILLSSIYGGLLNGLGMGLMFKNSTSQGGLDIIAMILRKEKDISISTPLLIMNFFVVAIASTIYGIEKGMYTLIAMNLGYKTVDKVVSGFDTKKQVIIISKDYEKISKKILVDPHRGVTLLSARGAFTGDHKEVLYVVASSRQIVRIKQVVKEIDPKAFISISDMIEVSGKGFYSDEDF